MTIATPAVNQNLTAKPEEATDPGAITVPAPESKPKCRVKPKLFDCTDAGNAELFAHLSEGDIRYDHSQGRWLFWTKDRRWVIDNENKVRQFAIGAARERIIRAAMNLGEDTPRQKQEFAWAYKSQSRHAIDAALELAKSMEPISDSGAGWDADPWLFGVAKGVVDLRTGKLREEKREDKITKRSPVAFDPDAKCPLFEGFLRTIFPKSPEAMSRYFQKLLGYTLTGDGSEQRSFFNHGDGSNGKGTLFETIRFIMGDYAVNLPFAALEHSKWGNSATNELVPLFGARFATSSETGDGMRLNEARIKSLTGGDPITARLLHCNSFTFFPTHKLWLAFNHKPVVEDDSYGFWRRVDLIEYCHKFVEKKSVDSESSAKDKKFLSKLKKEAPGILAFAVRGCLLWQKEGLERPPDVETATAAYQEESDTFGQFISERCVIEPGAQVLWADLWKAYEDWVNKNEDHQLTRKTFGDRLAKLKGVKKGRGKKGEKARDGIRLRQASSSTSSTKHAVEEIKPDGTRVWKWVSTMPTTTVDIGAMYAADDVPPTERSSSVDDAS